MPPRSKKRTSASHLQCSEVRVGARTRQAAHSLLRTALRAAVRLNCIVYSPAERVDPPRHTSKRRPVLDHDQVRALLRAAKSDCYEAVILLGVLHGLRIGEIAGLRWRDLDFRKGVMRVRHTLVENPRTGERTLEEPKTESSKRDVPLSKLVLEALRRHRERLGVVPHGSRLVFTDQQGGPLRRSNFHRRVWRPLLKRAELDKIGLTFHDLRHCAASTQLAAGTDVPTVSGMLGHSSAAVTMKIYAHALPSAKREAAAKVDELFGG